MNRSLIVALMLALMSASLAGCSGEGGVSGAGSTHEEPGAHDAHDAHAAHDAVMTAPPEGKTWPTDEPLRTGMSRIEAGVEQARATSEPVSREQALRLAQTVEENVTYIVRNCKLPPEPDAALHVLIGRMMAAAAQLKDDATSGQAVTQLDGVLQDYRATFDHARSAAEAS